MSENAKPLIIMDLLVVGFEDIGVDDDAAAEDGLCDPLALVLVGLESCTQ